MKVAPLAYVTRSGFVEGVHHGSAIAVDRDGRVLLSHGDPTAAMLPRSSLKPLQLLAMLRAGLRLDGDRPVPDQTDRGGPGRDQMDGDRPVPDQMDGGRLVPDQMDGDRSDGQFLDGELLALAAASHSGEPYHLAGVDWILKSAGLTEDALLNTADLPLGTDERLRWQRQSIPASRRAHNCSGKHAAMLATCRLNGWPEASYLDPTHPLQRLVADTVADLAGEPVAATTVDGCGAPALAISLSGLARAFGRLAVAPPDTPEGRIANAVRNHPQWLGGTDREVTELIRGVPGLIAKDGAEAVYAAALPDGRAVALKIADGSERARQVVVVALLRRLGIDEPALEEMEYRPVLGHGEPVGAVQAADL